jgi:hypothetical protein
MDAAELLNRTVRIESEFEALGAEGSGIWEKYKKFESMFPADMKQKIIDLGMARNSVIHGNPHIKNKTNIFALCDEIDRILEDNAHIRKLSHEVRRYTSQLAGKYKNIAEIDEGLSHWVESVVRQEGKCTYCGTVKFDDVIKSKEKRYLKMLSDAVSKDTKRWIVWGLVALMMGIIAAYVYYKGIAP